MALYNNGFPQTYQPYIPQTYQQPVMQAQNNAPSNGGIIWVQGEAGAKSYLVAPNTTVQLWDSENQIIYLKSADASGMPSMKIIDYTIRGTEMPQNDTLGLENKFICKDEFDSLKSKIDALESEIGRLKSKNNNRKEHNNG